MASISQTATSETRSAHRTRASRSGSRFCTTPTASSAGASRKTRRCRNLSACITRLLRSFRTVGSGFRAPIREFGCWCFLLALLSAAHSKFRISSNDGVTTVTYKTRYEVEMLSPPYMSMPRPTFSGQPANILYDKTYSLKISLPKGTKKVQAALLDVGYSTHGVHMSQRWVELDATLNSQTKLTIRGPKTTGLYPPGECRACSKSAPCRFS